MILLVCRRFFGSVLRPEVKVTFANDFVRVGDVEIVGDCPAGAKKAALPILEINLVGDLLEQEIEELFRVRGRLAIRGWLGGHIFR
jgi:hypothetical protein